MKASFPPWTSLTLAALLLTACSRESPPAPPAEPAPPTSPPPVGAFVEGHAVINLRLKNSLPQVQAGMELVLVPAETATELKRIRDERWLEQALRTNFDDGFRYLDLQAIGYAASQAAVARAKTGPDGSFLFSGVAPGSYRLYGQYKSNFAAGYWLIPVEITAADQTVHIEVNNETAAELFNRKFH